MIIKHIQSIQRGISKGIQRDKQNEILKGYFITASLIALLKRVGEETAKAAPRRAKTAALAKVRH